MKSRMVHIAITVAGDKVLTYTIKIFGVMRCVIWSFFILL